MPLLRRKSARTINYKKKITYVQNKNRGKICAQYSLPEKKEKWLITHPLPTPLPSLYVVHIKLNSNSFILMMENLNLLRLLVRPPPPNEIQHPVVHQPLCHVYNGRHGDIKIERDSRNVLAFDSISINMRESMWSSFGWWDMGSHIQQFIIAWIRPIHYLDYLRGTIVITSQPRSYRERGVVRCITFSWPPRGVYFAWPCFAHRVFVGLGFYNINYKINFILNYYNFQQLFRFLTK